MVRRITIEHRTGTRTHPPLEIRRSPKRRSTAAAHARDGTIVVQLPAALPAAEEERIIHRLVRKVTGAARAEQAGGDRDLARRAARLADRYVDGVRPGTIRWSGRMARRNGSCQPTTGVINISRRLAAFPTYVLDYVIVHELAHLRVADHSSAFWGIVSRFPDAERAKGFLEGIQHAEATLAHPPSNG